MLLLLAALQNLLFAPAVHKEITPGLFILTLPHCSLVIEIKRDLWFFLPIKGCLSIWLEPFVEFPGVFPGYLFHHILQQRIWGCNVFSKGDEKPGFS